MSGLPLVFVRRELNDMVNFWIMQIDLLFKNYILHDNGFYLNSDSQTAYLAKEAIAYAILPSLPIRALGLIIPYSILLGIPLILKSNQVVAPILFRIIDILQEIHYPEGGINIISFDDSEKEAQNKHEKLIQASEIIWTFGDDSEYRYKSITTPSGKIQLDLLNDKVAIRHPFANSTALVINDKNIDQTIDYIMDSCLAIPFECMALKSLYIVEKCYDIVKEKLIEKFNNLQKSVGNPLQENILIGYADEAIVNSATRRILDLEQSGLITVISGRENLFVPQYSKHSFFPILMETNDELLDLLKGSFPIISLVLKKCTDVEDGINMINTVTDKKRLEVVFYGDCQLPDKTLLKTNAILLRTNESTLMPDITHHDGNCYFQMLTDIKRIIKN
jgi:hypothetical protein